MPAAISVTSGDKYARLTIIKEVNPIRKSKRTFLCRCQCGTKKTIILENIRSGNTKSCGCYEKETTIIRNTTHNKCRTRIYNIWRAMKQRCFYEKGSHFYRYGGRGITVCEEWIEFKPFYNWAIKNGYSDKLTLDREDNDGNYEPSNCRWATTKEQARNNSRNKFVEYKGETKILQDWANQLGMSRMTLSQRIEKWGIKKAFKKPLRRGGNFISYKGESLCQNDWAKKLNISPSKVSMYIKKLGEQKAIEILTKKNEN